MHPLKRILRLAERLLFPIQKAILHISYCVNVTALRFKKMRDIDWVVGVEEIAALNKYISTSIKNSYSVNLNKNRFYSFQYSFEVKGNNDFIRRVKRLVYAPILLGRLVVVSKGFIYIWSTRFLLSSIDEGEYEYKFIQDKGCKIVLFFVGSDIRSPKLTKNLGRMHGLEVEADYYEITKKRSLAEDHEKRLQKRVLVSERFASLIFTAKNDQASYFSKVTSPFIYFYPDGSFYKNKDKFKRNKRVCVVHSPSNPITKGTQLVRAAITRLKNEGYDLKYIELMNVPNEVVLHELRGAHVVLNEFYGLVPGVFGIEAMANYCALMTAADEHVETDLPAGSNQAWLSTKSYEVYDNLKYLLDNPEQQVRYADSGYQWALENAAQSASGSKLQKLLDSIC